MGCRAKGKKRRIWRSINLGSIYARNAVLENSVVGLDLLYTISGFFMRTAEKNSWRKNIKA
jgi:hypothetical protein